MVVQYMRNKNNMMLYKAVNNCLLLMWSPRLKQWIKPFTQYSDLFIGEYLENFYMLNEDEVDIK